MRVLLNVHFLETNSETVQLILSSIRWASIWYQVDNILASSWCHHNFSWL